MTAVLIICPRCGFTVTNRRDIRTGWCAQCKDWTMPDQESRT